MKRILKFMAVVASFLSGCATGQGTEVVIPTGNITTVYQPPTTSSVTFELVVAVLLVAMVAYLLIGKLWRHSSKKRHSKPLKKVAKKKAKTRK